MYRNITQRIPFYPKTSQVPCEKDSGNTRLLSCWSTTGPPPHSITPFNQHDNSHVFPESFFTGYLTHIQDMISDRFLTGHVIEHRIFYFLLFQNRQKPKCKSQISSAYIVACRQNRSKSCRIRLQFHWDHFQHQKIIELGEKSLCNFCEN